MQLARKTRIEEKSLYEISVSTWKEEHGQLTEIPLLWEGTVQERTENAMSGRAAVPRDANDSVQEN